MSEVQELVGQKEAAYLIGAESVLEKDETSDNRLLATDFTNSHGEYIQKISANLCNTCTGTRCTCPWQKENVRTFVRRSDLYCSPS